MKPVDQLSPTLCSTLYINDLIVEIEPAGFEIRLSNFRVGTFLLAADVILLAKAEQAWRSYYLNLVYI